MSPNLGSFERAVRFVLGVFLLFAAWQLFTHPVARVAAALIGLGALWEGAVSKCLLHSRLGMLAPGDRLKPEMLRLLGLAAIQVVIAYEWWSAGWEKVSGPGFVADIGKTLGFFASKNPFPWYKGFLEGFASKNATAFAYAVEWTQVVIALTLAASAAYFAYRPQDGWWTRRLMRCAIWCLLAGVMMNANFYLAAGWTGPGTKGSNVVMFWTQIVLIYVWVSTLRDKKPPTEAPRA